MYLARHMRGTASELGLTYLVKFNEVSCNAPGCITYDLINITAVPKRFIPFIFCHDSEPFVLVC